MRSQFDIHLKENEQKAVRMFKGKVSEHFPGAEFILFGSKAKGNDGEFSDVDVLVIIDGDVGREVEKKVFDIGYDIELEFDVIFGIIVESRNFWDSALCRETPLRKNIDREGILI